MLRYKTLVESISKQIKKAGKLSSIDPKLAKVISTSGRSDGDLKDDRVQVRASTWKAAVLKPSQTSMVLGKSLGMALFMLKTGNLGGDLGAIVSSDNFIMDGHHRWSASILAGGKKVSVGGYRASVPGEKLLKILNIATKGVFGVKKGNPGKGSLKDYTYASVKKMLTSFSKSGIPGDFPWSPEDVNAVLESNFGSIEAGIEEISSNANLIPSSVPKWAPDRVDMPVINPEQVPVVANKLANGEIDHSSPYSDDVRESTDLDEALTAAQRMKRKASFRKNKAKIAIGRKKAEKRTASGDTLKARARKSARKEVEKKILKGKNKSDLSLSARQSLEKRVEKKKSQIDQIARKELPKARKRDRDKKK